MNSKNVSEILKEAAESPQEECQQMWNFFDEMMPEMVMTSLMSWAAAGRTTAEIYNEIITKNESRFIGLGEAGRIGMALAIEYATRQFKGIL